jgi:hypothetical protein
MVSHAIPNNHRPQNHHIPERSGWASPPPITIPGEQSAHHRGMVPCHPSLSPFLDDFRTIHDKPPHRYPSPSVFPNDRELRASSLRHALTIDSCPIPHNSQTQPAVAPKPTTFPNDQKSPHVSNRAIAEPQGVVSPQSTKPITIAECRPRTIRSGEPQTVPKTPPGRSGMVSPPGR